MYPHSYYNWIFNQNHSFDAWWDKDVLTISFAMPGMEKGDIFASINNGILEVKADRKADEDKRDYLYKSGLRDSYLYRIELPDTVDEDKAEVSYANGVLTVSIQKLESKKKKYLAIK